jgi:protein-S-isoprenylcysteine O-methyltransferase Ste14
MKLYKSDLHIVVASAGLALLFVGYRSPWTPQHIAGAALVVAGYAGWLVARLELRAYFTARAEARGLVTHGIYSKIRNPIYIFGGLLILGATIYLSAPWWVPPLLFSVLVPLQVWRARNEARVLETKFGDAYRDYRRNTWF